MKSILLATLCLAQAAFAEPKKPVPSTIQQVTVFLSGAQITRNATASLIPGTNILTFSGLSPDIDDKSIQVQGDGAFTILSVTSQKNYIQEQEQREEVTGIQNQLEELKEKISHEQNMLHVYTEEAAMLNKNQSIGGNNTGVKTTDLKEAMDFQRTRLTEIMDKQQGIQKNIATLQRSQQKLVSQLQALQQQKKDPTSDISVTVSSKVAVNAKFMIRYVVKNAGWYPNYDIRVQNISEPLTLQYKAHVYQQCGEEWKNVKLSLSTGNPNDRSVKPTLMPWYMNLYSNESELLNQRQYLTDIHSHETNGRVLDDNGVALVGVSVQVKGRTIGTMSDVNGNFQLQLPEGTQTLKISYIGFEPQEVSANGNDFKSIALQPSRQDLSEVVVAGYAADMNKELEGRVAGVSPSAKKSMSYKTRNPGLFASQPLEVAEHFSSTTFNYDIALPYTIPNDGKPYAVDVKEMEVPALFQYYAIPKLEKKAFLMAGITGWEDLNLLEGEANIYFEGTYLGRTLLDLQTTSDTLYLSLGEDKQVVVNRILQKEYSKKQFLANNNTAERTWKLRVKNNKQVPIHITVQDQLPISATKEIEISHIEHVGATETANTGQLNWDLNLAPSAEQKMTLKYSVKYPRDKVINLD